MSRYRVAMAQGRAAYEAAVDEDAELLKFFGLKLLALNECVRAAVISEIKGNRINPWNVVELNMKTWELMRPILVEAREARQEREMAGSDKSTEAEYLTLTLMAAK